MTSNIPAEKSPKIISVVDVGELGLGHKQDPSEQELQRVGKKISEAFKETGFVYLEKHGIPDEQLEKLVNAGAAFFNLPQEEKDKWPRDPSKQQQGYIAANREKFQEKYSYEIREAIDIKRPEGIFPDSIIPDLRPATADFMASCKALAKRLLTAIALEIGLDRDFFLNNHQDMGTDNNITCLRLLHYPPVSEDTPANAIRCGTHTDYGTMSLLFQDDVGGLYVRDRSGNWTSADPIPGTILVNVGDLLQLWTSGKFVATEHQVVIPEEEIKRRKCRRSVAYFVQPDDQVMINPLDGSKDYEPVNARDHVLKKFCKTYAY